LREALARWVRGKHHLEGVSYPMSGSKDWSKYLRETSKKPRQPETKKIPC